MLPAHPLIYAILVPGVRGICVRSERPTLVDLHGITTIIIFIKHTLIYN